MDHNSNRPTLSKLFQASESKRNTAYDALSEEFDDDFQRLIKEMIEIINMINPARANKYRLKKLVVEFGYKCETLEDLKMCLNTLKCSDIFDETDNVQSAKGLDVPECGSNISDNVDR